jgi:hypothetical protein
MLWQYCIDQHAASERILLEKSQAAIKGKLDAHWFAEPVKMSLTQVQPVTSNGASQTPCKTTEGIRVSCSFCFFAERATIDRALRLSAQALEV